MHSREEYYKKYDDLYAVYLIGVYDGKIAAQRPLVGLTDEEPMQIWDEVIKYAPSEMRIKDFALAIEAKLKEKNNG